MHGSQECAFPFAVDFGLTQRTQRNLSPTFSSHVALELLFHPPFDPSQSTAQYSSLSTALSFRSLQCHTRCCCCFSKRRNLLNKYRFGSARKPRTGSDLSLLDRTIGRWQARVFGSTARSARGHTYGKRAADLRRAMLHCSLCQYHRFPQCTHYPWRTGI